MKAPEIYYEWAQVLNILKEGKNDEEALQALQTGTIVEQTGVFERLVQRIGNVLNARFDMATKSFKNAVEHSTEGSLEMNISKALGILAKEMGLMPKLASLPALREKDRKALTKQVQDQINQIGASLVKSAKADRTGKMASILKSKGFKV